MPGAGAGVGLFSPAPFTKTYGNVVVNNDLTDNGLPGVAMHAHSPGALLSDNMIVGNRISGNGADTEDTATSGPTGVNVSGGDDGSRYTCGGDHWDGHCRQRDPARNDWSGSEDDALIGRT